MVIHRNEGAQSDWPGPGKVWLCLIHDRWMEIILRGVDDGLLPADDGMPWHVKNQIIFPLTSQSVSYFIFKSNRKMMIQLGRILSYQMRKDNVYIFIPTEIHSQILLKSSLLITRREEEVRRTSLIVGQSAMSRYFSGLSLIPLICPRDCLLPRLPPKLWKPPPSLT